MNLSKIITEFEHKGASLENLMIHAHSVGLNHQQLGDLSNIIKEGLIKGYECPYKEIMINGESELVVDNERMKTELIELIDKHKRSLL